jgi:predicted RNA binding protein YcfA (HicA-like mRNA interferase family)
VTYGRTLSEAKTIAQDAISAYIESLKKHNEPLPTDEESFVAPLNLEYAETSTVKPREIIRFLEPNGFRLDHAPGGHAVYSHPALKRRAAVPEHNRDLPKDALLLLLGAAALYRGRPAGFLQGR